MSVAVLGLGREVAFSLVQPAAATSSRVGRLERRVAIQSDIAQANVRAAAVGKPQGVVLLRRAQRARLVARGSRQRDRRPIHNIQIDFLSSRDIWLVSAGDADDYWNVGTSVNLIFKKAALPRNAPNR
jgi:hypothetical protein